MLYRLCALFCLLFSSYADGILTFDETVARVFVGSPDLKISESEVEGSEGQAIQAGLYPNPIASYSVENVFGNKHWKGWESAESRYELAQLVELGGKRANRTGVAQNEYYASQASLEASKVDLMNRLLKLFVSVVAAQEQLKVAAEQKEIADEVLHSVSAKVDAGKVSIIQKSKAEIAFINAEIKLDQANVNLRVAKERLALLWGSSCADFDEAAYPFFDIQQPKAFAQCMEDLCENPELLEANFAFLASEQRVKLEKSNAVPDVIVSIGYKTLEREEKRGMILGAAIPIPVFNQNQGNIYTAHSEMSRYQQELLDTQLQLENKLSLSHQELMRSYTEAMQIQTRVLHSAGLAFDLAKKGYLEGKFEYLEMLDSQRTLFEVKENYIQALLNYHQRRADIEYLTTRVD